MGDQSAGPINPMAKRLMLVNAIRSIGQGIMVVDLALYLHALGWKAATIGGVIAAGGLLEAVLLLFVGVCSDRLGRKPFILFNEMLIAGCALVGVLTTHFVLLSIAIMLSGFGKAQNGSPGPCAPAEQAWLSAYVPISNRGKLYSINNAFGFFGMSIGAFLAGATALWDHTITGASTYRPLFGFIFILSLITITIISSIHEEKEDKPFRTKERNEISQEGNNSRRENIEILKLASINIINGIAIGLTGPMMSYWFATKFGANNTVIGSTLAVTFFATGVASILQAKLSNKNGAIRSVVWVRFIASLLLIILPLLSTYALVATVYILRTALNRGTQGAQLALSVSLTRDRRRGFASSVNALSLRIPTSIGPYISGSLFGAGLLSLPFFIAAGLQFSFAYLYGKMFSTYDHRMKRAITGKNKEFSRQ